MPTGKLFVGVFAVHSTHSFTELLKVQSFAKGAVRQFGVYVIDSLSTQLMSLRSKALRRRCLIISCVESRINHINTELTEQRL